MTRKNNSPLPIETLVTSFPSQTYNWIIDDMFTQVTLPATETLSYKNTPNDWRTSDFSLDEGFFFDSADLYVPSTSEEYLYERIDISGYVHNEDAIMAVEKTQDNRKILWEHIIPKISNDSHRYLSR
jgi:hypothetical protein